MGVDGLELDVQEARDALVVHHDATFHDEHIAKLSLARIAGRQGESVDVVVPTLLESLAVIAHRPGTMVLVELKNVNTIASYIDEIKPFTGKLDIRTISFNAQLIGDSS